MYIRELTRDEIPLVWAIDRREVIDGIYVVQNGELVLRPEHFDVHGWPPGEAEKYTPILTDCFDRGGAFFGAFEADRLVGVAVLESAFIGKDADQLQLKFLQVSRENRGHGLGRLLFELSARRAKELGAKRLYISATPSQHTVEFYLRLGCFPAAEPDPELYALEPDDIHLGYGLADDRSVP